VQRLDTAGPPAAVPDAHGLGGDAELASDLSLGDAGSEQLRGTQSAGLELLTFS
jgi:hypothetical protein